MIESGKFSRINFPSNLQPLEKGTVLGFGQETL